MLQNLDFAEELGCSLDSLGVPRFDFEALSGDHEAPERPAAPRPWTQIKRRSVHEEWNLDPTRRNTDDFLQENPEFAAELGLDFASPLSGRKCGSQCHDNVRASEYHDIFVTRDTHVCTDDHVCTDGVSSLELGGATSRRSFGTLTEAKEALGGTVPEVGSQAKRSPSIVDGETEAALAKQLAKERDGHEVPDVGSQAEHSLLTSAELAARLARQREKEQQQEDEIHNV